MSMQNVYDCLSPPERLGNAPVGSDWTYSDTAFVSGEGAMVGKRERKNGEGMWPTGEAGGRS